MTRIVSKRARVDCSKTHTAASSTMLISNDGVISNRASFSGSKGTLGRAKQCSCVGVIDELTKSAPSASHTTAISFFSCQATNVRISHATAVLRGLIFMLVEQQLANTANRDRLIFVPSKTPCSCSVLRVYIGAPLTLDLMHFFFRFMLL